MHLAACNDEGSRRLVEMMEEFGIANLDRLGEHIIETSRQATIEAIGKLKQGPLSQQSDDGRLSTGR